MWKCENLKFDKTQKLKLHIMSKTQIVRNLTPNPKLWQNSKSQGRTQKLKFLNKHQELKVRLHLKTGIVARCKDLKCDIAKNLSSDKTKNSNSDKSKQTQVLKKINFWQKVFW